jgi:membrane protein required for colicin V production
MVTFTWVDVALMLIILWSVAVGVRAGLARVLVGFCATIAAFLVGFWFYPMVAAKLAPWIANKTLANFFGFIILFIGVLLVGSLVSALLSKLFEWVGLSWFNRVLGGAAGFIRGILIVAVMVDVLVAFAPSPTPQMLQRSVVVPYVSSVAAWLIDMAPYSLKAAFDQEMENLKQYWRNETPPKGTQAA